MYQAQNPSFAQRDLSMSARWIHHDRLITQIHRSRPTNIRTLFDLQLSNAEKVSKINRQNRPYLAHRRTLSDDEKVEMSQVVLNVATRDAGQRSEQNAFAESLFILNALKHEQLGEIEPFTWFLS